MRTRRVMLGVLLLAGAGVIEVLVSGALREREPEYGGKRLSEWVTSYPIHGPPQAKEEADDAMKHIGTNAVPYLIKWMSYEATPWKIKLYDGLPEVLRRPFNGWVRKDGLGISASSALGRLGPDARGAVPELVRLLNDPTRIYSGGRAATVLGKLGDGYLPTLLAALTNRPAIRGSIIIGIGSMGTNARPAIPAVTNLLNDPDPAVRRIAASVLHRIDPETVKKAGRQ